MIEYAGPPLTALGRVDSESGGHAYRAANRAGWTIDETNLLSLGPLEKTLATASRLRDLGVVVRLGHGGQPDPELERALLEAPGAVMAVDSVLVEPSWKWVATSASPRPTVVIDRVALAECAPLLTDRGIIPRVVPSATDLRSRLELAADGSSVIIDAAQAPNGWLDLPESEALATLPALWFGLIRSMDRRPSINGKSTVWLTFGPRIDETGTLMTLLDDFADFGIDLSHLRSFAGTKGRHVFFSAFAIEDKAVLDSLLDRLSGKNVQHRVLAVLPEGSTTGGPSPVVPEWNPYD